MVIIKNVVSVGKRAKLALYRVKPLIPCGRHAFVFRADNRVIGVKGAVVFKQFISAVRTSAVDENNLQIFIVLQVETLKTIRQKSFRVVARNDYG